MSLQNGSATVDDFNPFVNGMGIQYNQLMFNISTVCHIFYELIFKLIEINFRDRLTYSRITPIQIRQSKWFSHSLGITSKTRTS